jgi:adenylate cyclase
MAFEIEKKFLIKHLPEAFDKDSYEILEQAYIFSEPETRIRRAGEKFFLTVKSKGDAVREEYEMEISEKIFEKFKAHIETPFIRKKRHEIILEDGLVAELDIYLDFENLITVDVEFANYESMASFIPPSWFGEDISGNLNYKNSLLARKLAL